MQSVSSGIFYKCFSQFVLRLFQTHMPTGIAGKGQIISCHLCYLKLQLIPAKLVLQINLRKVFTSTNLFRRINSQNVPHCITSPCNLGYSRLMSFSLLHLFACIVILFVCRRKRTLQTGQVTQSKCPAWRGLPTPLQDMYLQLFGVKNLFVSSSNQTRTARSCQEASWIFHKGRYQIPGCVSSTLME